MGNKDYVAAGLNQSAAQKLAGALDEVITGPPRMPKLEDVAEGAGEASIAAFFFGVSPVGFVAGALNSVYEHFHPQIGKDRQRYERDARLYRAEYNAQHPGHSFD